MENEILFIEKQQFRQWWLWLVWLGINALVFKELLMPPSPGETLPMISFILPVIINLLVIALLFFSRLDTQIKKDGIYVRFFPFHFSFKHFTWNEIVKLHIREYSPVKEYGGWGLRGLGVNKAYNVSGNKGLQLIFLDGRKLLIGTKKGDEITGALTKLGQLKK